LNFYTVRDLRTIPKTTWDHLSADGNFEEVLRAIRRTKAIMAFNNIRKIATESGFMADDKIEAEITAARRGA
jgi:hypothetical protein